MALNLFWGCLHQKLAFHFWRSIVSHSFEVGWHHSSPRGLDGQELSALGGNGHQGRGHGIWNVDGQGQDVGMHRLQSDPGTSYFSVFSLDGAVNGILVFVLGNLEVHMHSHFWWCPAPLEHSIHQQGKHPFSPGQRR